MLKIYFSDAFYYGAINITNGFRRIGILGNHAEERQKVFPWVLEIAGLEEQ
jgi:hypothetical protein